jgi:SSS family solute:Na+ symporter
MHFVDFLVFCVYAAAIVFVGVWFLRKNTGNEDYFLGGRNMSYPHIGLSVVATDVGGGFSIGLGGLGFMMGLSGSWLLFTGLLGAWLSAVYLIPIVKPLSDTHRFFTMPQLFHHVYGKRAAYIAAVISAVGYIGFTSAQMLAGAKLASATFPEIGLTHALWIMGVIIVGYTVMGGIKAVIYTDTIQWLLLMVGLCFIGIPIAWSAVGGYSEIVRVLDPGMLRLDRISIWQAVNWAVTIIPIWFVGMTLYQRIYASRNVNDAKKAWYVAGFFEWPVMAFMGVLLGLLSRVAAEQGMFASLGYADASLIDPEMGLPMLLRTVLPVGFMGLMLAAYFSAVMSTADSCLVAASGNVVSDILKPKNEIRSSQRITLLLGGVAIGLASFMENVLDVMLYSYAFMVSGLFIPVLAALFLTRHSPKGAILAMIGGGSVTVWFTLSPPGWIIAQADPNVYGLLFSTLLYTMCHVSEQKNRPI